MTIPNGPIVGGKVSAFGVLLFAGVGIAFYFLLRKLFKQEIVVTDAAGNTTKIGEVKTSLSFGKAKTAGGNATKNTTNAATDAASK